MLPKQTLSWQGVPKPSLTYRLPWRAVPLENFSSVSHCAGKKVFHHQLKFLTGATQYLGKGRSKHCAVSWCQT